MKLFSAFAVALLVASCAIAGPPALPTDSLAFLSHTTTERMCSSFAVRDNYFLAAAHCGVLFDEGKAMEDVLIDGHPAQVVAFDTIHDILLLKTLDGYAKPPVTLSTTVKMGSDVYEVGTPFHPSVIVAIRNNIVGVLPSSVTQTDERWLMMWGGTGPGMSGSPIVNDHGDVISITSRYQSSMPNLVLGPLPGDVQSLLRAYFAKQLP